MTGLNSKNDGTEFRVSDKSDEVACSGCSFTAPSAFGTVAVFARFEPGSARASGDLLEAPIDGAAALPSQRAGGLKYPRPRKGRAYAAPQNMRRAAGPAFGLR